MANVFGTDLAEFIDALDGVTNGDDVILGRGGNDAIYGLGGNDLLKGGGGADYLNGGIGNDTATYDDSTAAVQIDLSLNSAHGGTAEGDFFISIENLRGSRYSDDLRGDAGANTLWGEAGNDYLSGGAGTDTINGGSGNDTIVGGASADVMDGGDGFDAVTYMESTTGVHVSLATGRGSNGTAQADLLINIEGIMGSGHADVLEGDGRDNQLVGRGGNDWLMGGGGRDYLSGEGDQDILDGGTGADDMWGGLGSDTYYVDDAGDQVTERGGEGTDTVRASVSYTLTAGADVETLSTVDDLRFAAIDLTGNATSNQVRGNNGANVINGGDGNDQLVGLGGANSFLFNTALNAATNVDRLTDFTVVDDTIRLENAIFTAFAAGALAADRFVVGTAARDANDNIIYNSATGALLYDSDGTGAAAAIQFATLTSGLALTSLDFVIV